MKRIAGTEKILIVGSDRDYFSRLSKVLIHKNNRLEILYFVNKEETLIQLEKKPDIKLVLIDNSMERHEFENVLNHVKKHSAMQILIISEQTGNNTSGYEQEFVNKLDIDKINDCIVARLNGYSKIKKDSGISKTSLRQDIENQMGKGKVISEVLDRVEKYATINEPFLIEGETGTGKELIAKYWYSLSGLKKIVTVNCATLSNELADTELFGSTRGAYTDAENKEGIVKTADGGMLFFDEFNSLPLGVQVKILRLIEQKTYYKVGDTVEQKANVRIIAAGNKSFSEMVRKGEMRRDLYERFTKTIYIPTLAERIEDMDYFIDRFIAEENKKRCKNVSISNEARKFLADTDWPGNIRQLKNFITVLVIEVEPDRSSKKLIIQVPLIRQCLNERQQSGESDDIRDDDYTLQNARNKAEKKVIMQTLDKTGGNIEEAIKLLGISRKTYFNLKRKLGI